MLELHNVVSGYGQVRALKGISLEVEQGQIVSIVGANGAGKTTTLKTIAGLLKAEDGSIRFEERDLRNVWPHNIVGLGISLVPEGRKIFADLTVMENLRIGAYGRNDNNEIAKDAERMFELFPSLQGRGKQLGGTLSGGEQQMLAIARGLMSRPRLLMMDEPSLGLAPIIVDALFAIIKDINSLDTTILLVEQNAQMALSIGDKGYVMEVGRIVMEDTCKNLLQNEQVQRAYLGMGVSHA
jgi:branched-chain amino acid transport system ATP-binding protein